MLNYFKKQKRTQTQEESSAGFLDHLEALRNCLVKIATALMIGWGIGWFLQPIVYELLAETSRDLVPAGIEYKETFRSITDPFMLKLKLAFCIGAVIVAPWCLVQLWGFVAPALSKREKKPLFVLLPLSTLLFAVGAFCCWLVLPKAFGWFISYIGEFPQTAIYQEPGMLIFFIVKMMGAFGIGFQLPIVIFLAAKMNLVTAEQLLGSWRFAVLVIFGLSMVFVPAADPISLLMLALPLCLLYFLSILAVKITTKRQAKVFDYEPVS